MRVNNISTDSGRSRLHSLDLLRGISAIGVCLYHFHLWNDMKLEGALGQILMMFGTYGVSMFFALSGYSLAHAYGNTFSQNIQMTELARYLRRRIGRIAPLFLLVVAISLVGKLLVTKNFPDIFSLAANIFLLFGFLNPAATPVVGGWSIGVELVYYAILPISLIAHRSPIYFVAAAIFFTIWISSSILAYSTLAEGWLLYVHPANHAVFFFGGVALKQFGLSLRWFDKWWGVAFFLVVMILAAWAGFNASELELVTGWRRAIFVVGTLAFVVFAVRISIGESFRPIAGSLGEASYSIYLIHPLVFFAVKGRIDTGVYMYHTFFLTLLLGIAVTRFVDAPLQRKVKGLGW